MFIFFSLYWYRIDIALLCCERNSILSGSVFPNNRIRFRLHWRVRFLFNGWMDVWRDCIQILHRLPVWELKEWFEFVFSPGLEWLTNNMRQLHTLNRILDLQMHILSTHCRLHPSPNWMIDKSSCFEMIPAQLHPRIIQWKEKIEYWLVFSLNLGLKSQR